MSDKVSEAIEVMTEVLKSELSKCTISVEIVVTAQGFNVGVQERSADGLKRDGISMRNIQGEWIK